MESARRYIQTARALLASQQVPAELADLGASYSSGLLAIVDYCLTSVPPAKLRHPATRVAFPSDC
jgi:hypothetical protein